LLDEECGTARHRRTDEANGIGSAQTAQ